jgi:hypothetical protein
MAYKLNGKTLQADRGFTHNGIQYPRNWLKLSSQGDRDAIGITWEADPVRADDRYYWDGDVNNPKALDDVTEEVDGETSTTYGLKHTMTAQVKDTAGKMLATTDWYVTRLNEKSTAIPADVTTKRDAIRTECDRLETAIADATTVEALIEVMNSQDWGEE